VLIAARPRPARLAGIGVWAAGAAILAVYLAPSGHHRAILAAGVLGVPAAIGLALLLRRWPWALAVLTLACVPARIPVHVGGTQANLLLPLYLVVASAALVLALELARGEARARELGRVAAPLAAYVAWTGVSLLWTDDVRQGAIAVLFFYLPFGLLAVALARLSWNPRALVLLWVELVAMAVAFAGIGVYQWVTRDVFWNPKVIVGNAYAPFFRVNSVFYDPSVYGRFLVVAIVACLVVVLHSRAVRAAWIAAATIAVAWVGLLFSFSQSSFAALIAVVLVLAAMAWRWRAAAALGLVAAVLVSAGVAAPRVRSTIIRHTHTGLTHATSGRSKLVINGVKLVAHHPLLGVGIGSFKRSYAKQQHLRGKEPKSAASHDTPVTVAAELGLPGLALFVWLVAVALLVSLRRVPRTFAGRASVVFGLALAAIAVHSLFYNAFFEDPTTWGLLALGALAARAPGKETV
jgi:putative inorganic carbon (HCO3(-)) transporter